MIKNHYLLAILAISTAIASCTTDDEVQTIVDENPLVDYYMLTSLKANGHDIEIYSEQDQFTIGYNELFLRIKDEETDDYLSGAEISWTPVMHMTDMMHSCPRSSVAETENTSVYSGFIVFQMSGNAEEYWELELDYTIDGQSYMVAERISVNAASGGRKTVNSFMGSDDSRYIVVMVPFAPEVKVNAFSAMVFEIENMMNFPAVEDYKIAIDPRMPGMGNHGSPNNEDLIYDSSPGMYTGKLSLTMTGYWKINLKLMNEADEVLKGETVTEENESSSLFFEIEF